jgi:hypothetical protein
MIVKVVKPVDLVRLVRLVRFFILVKVSNASQG